MSTEKFQAVLGISGHKRSGKDHAYNVIRNILPAGAVSRVAFADALKQECAEFLAQHRGSFLFDELNARSIPIDVIGQIMQSREACLFEYRSGHGQPADAAKFLDFFNSDKYKHHFRLLLQYWGTEYRRQTCGDDYWLRAWEKRVQETAADALLVVVPDVRFENELDFLCDIKGNAVFRLENPELPTADLHSSETSLDDMGGWDAVITNDMTAEFDARVIHAYSRYVWPNVEKALLDRLPYDPTFSAKERGSLADLVEQEAA